MPRKLTNEVKNKYQRWKYSQPGMREIRQGSPRQIQSVLERLENETPRQETKELGSQGEYTCDWCGEKYDSEYPRASRLCTECGEAGKLDSGDYNFGADEDN